MDAAARVKGVRNRVRDEDRIEDVVTKVKESCARVGLSPSIAEPVWRTMIDRCIAYEFRSYDARNSDDSDSECATRADASSA